VPSQVSVKSDTKELDKLLASLKTKLVTKIGIFSDNDNSRNDGQLTNVQVGMAHEFGVISRGLPRRSFLRDPIELKRKELVKKVGKIIAKNIDKEDGMEKIFELIGIEGEAIVQEAFETGGYGTWTPLNSQTSGRKDSSSILIDTAQLRKSVISKVEKRD
jgi:hypothetical protein